MAARGCGGQPHRTMNPWLLGRAGAGERGGGLQLCAVRALGGVRARAPAGRARLAAVRGPHR